MPANIFEFSGLGNEFAVIGRLLIKLRGVYMAGNPNQNSVKRIITIVTIIIGVGLIGIAIIKISIHHDKYDLYDPSKLAPGDIIDTIGVPAEIDSLLEKTQSKMFDLIYQEKVEKGLIILFKDEFGFRHAFFSNKMEVWNISGNTELSPKEGFTWTMTNDPNIPILTFAGLITDEDIQTVIVIQKSSTSQAKIITTTQGRFWFTHFDYLEEASGQPDALKIEALSGDGKVIWKEGIYDGTYYRGRT
ncbi:hypothetical protein I8J29_31635 [Paenibacillus sp. MWE-103]|uniref:Uncharacterized protein n=1 Tax=Paenibacillus artemisiicola TaxID=1172618 RepID=A0ABS3WK74_9BACL|nr:hypothetical protein [Paenibacillus artemisiicola]MBO7748731.1 hypothetical protein [Paenibacillus artemisiicola]